MYKLIKNILLKSTIFLLLIYLLVFIPKLWGKTPLIIISGSMEPILKVGGITYYQKYDIDKFEIGDIIVYQIPSDIISHRLIEKKNNGFITKGDRNEKNDDLIINNMILGKANNWSIPLIGYYVHFIYTHKYLLFIAMFIIILSILFDKYRGKFPNEENN